jgi:glycerophosphoryl diester phosphodiesterase
VIELRRRDGGFWRVAHRGASAIAPENTIRAFRAAVELGVDLVEFDVFELRDGTLVLAHSNDLFEVSHGASHGRVRPRTLAELRRVAPELPTLDEALSYLSEAGVGLHLDLKHPGAEAGVAWALRRHGVLERTVVSAFSSRSLRRLAALEPALSRGLSYPEDRLGISSRRRLAPFIRWGGTGLRRTLPLRIARLLARARAGAAMLHHDLVSAAAVNRCHAVGAAVFAWTVDDSALAERLVSLGVDGIITNDPRIFTAGNQ